MQKLLNGPAAKPLAIIAGFLVFIYVYPRFLISQLGEGDAWTSYLYMYGFGIAFFGLGLYIILKSGSCQLGRGYDSKWFKALVLGMTYFTCLHGIWVYLALTVPFKGN